LLSTHRIGVLVVLDSGQATRRRSVGARHRTCDGGNRNDCSEGAGQGGDDAQRLHL
jgi:hypothetical protein